MFDASCSAIRSWSWFASAAAGVLRHAARERFGLVAQRELRVRQVIGVDRQAERLAIAGDAADGDAAEVDAVIALLATDQRVFVPCPFARQYARAILSDVSAASEPEPQKNT